MNPDEKRQMIDGLYLNMIEIAKEGNKLYYEFENERKVTDGN